MCRTYFPAEGVNYVIIIIYNLSYWSVWKIIFLRSESGMGNLKVPADHCLSSGHPDCNGSWWITLRCIPGTNCNRRCKRIDKQKLSCTPFIYTVTNLNVMQKIF